MKICPNCHNPAADDAAFCTQCGTPLGNVQAQGTQQNAPAQSQPNAPFQNEPAPVPPVQVTPVVPPPAGQQYYPMPGMAQPAPDAFDHTSEYEAKDISDNKVVAMAVYLLGVVGMLIALLAAGNSPYAQFHVRQALKFTIVSTLATIAAAVLFWTIIVPILYVILSVALFVCKIIAFVQICGGKAKEPYIIRNLSFLK